MADAVPEGASIAEVADLDFTGDARAAALDLSLADGRFSPDVLEVAARRAVAAWAEAIDGADDALLALARPAAAREMLHPGDPSQAHASGRPRADGAADPDRRARRRRHATDDDDRGRSRGAPLPRGSRHRGRRRRQPGTGHEVHRKAGRWRSTATPRSRGGSRPSRPGGPALARPGGPAPADALAVPSRGGPRSSLTPRDPDQGQRPDRAIPGRHRRADPRSTWSCTCSRSATGARCSADQTRRRW